MPDGIDRLIVGFDRALRTLSGTASAARPNPAAGVVSEELTPEERRHVAGLMRVNHTGEVCAQALYQAQALVARDPARLPLARNAKYTENGVQLKLGDGMWGPVVKMTDYKLYFADPKAGQVGFYGSLEEHGHPAILGLRLKIEDQPDEPRLLVTVRGIGYRLLSG